VGLILDSSLLIADEREQFNLASWLRSRASEPVAVRAITLSELWFGIHVETEGVASARVRDGDLAGAVVLAPDYGSKDED